MLKKYSVNKPNEIRMRILEFCSSKCEFSDICFNLPLSNCCVKHKEIKEYINSN